MAFEVHLSKVLKDFSRSIYISSSLFVFFAFEWSSEVFEKTVSLKGRVFHFSRFTFCKKDSTNDEKGTFERRVLRIFVPKVFLCGTCSGPVWNLFETCNFQMGPMRNLSESCAVLVRILCEPCVEPKSRTKLEYGLESVNTCRIRIGSRKRARLLLVCLKNLKKSEVFWNLGMKTKKFFVFFRFLRKDMKKIEYSKSLLRGKVLCIFKTACTGFFFEGRTFLRLKRFETANAFGEMQFQQFPG